MTSTTEDAVLFRRNIYQYSPQWAYHDISLDKTHQALFSLNFLVKLEILENNFNSLPLLNISHQLYFHTTKCQEQEHPNLPRHWRPI